MDSGSGKPSRRSSKRRSRGAPKRRSQASRAPVSSSFAPPPSPSRGTIFFNAAKLERPVYKSYFWALCCVVLLILLGGGHHAFALGIALFLPGIALVARPPSYGLGKWADLGALGFLACLLLAFIPQFYWSNPDWRVTAAETIGLELPATLSVQPWSSLEGWLTTLAGFAWLYVAAQWRINFSGRRRLFFWLTLIVAGMAGIVVWGNLLGARYPGAANANAFSFFPDGGQTANLLILGGVLTFGYAMDSLRSRTLLPLVGLPVSILCLSGLVLAGARMGILFYFVGLAVWFVCSLGTRSIPRFFKLGFPLVVVAFALIIACNERVMQRILDFAQEDTYLSGEYCMAIYRDTVEMVKDAPISGFGLSNFSAVFPQYREASANYQRLAHPESDFLWLAAEGGLLALGFIALFLYGYSVRCRGLKAGASGYYRVMALVAVVIFLLHALVDVPGHLSGTVYFVVLFAALALPDKKRPVSYLPPLVWRGVGVVLLGFGLAWLAAGTFGLPWHSTVRLAHYQKEIQSDLKALDYGRAESMVEKWLALHPFDWRAYFQRAQLVLSESRRIEAAVSDFQRARFVEPIQGEVSFEEGEIWLKYDLDRTVSAWGETLHRQLEDVDATFARMLQTTASTPRLMERMARLSEMSPHFRTALLCYLKEEAFMSEIRRELVRDPALAGFTSGQRTQIVQHWIEFGELRELEAYLKLHAQSLLKPWWVWSLFYKQQADFTAAVESVRAQLDAPEIPEVEIDEAVLAMLMREYAAVPRDTAQGTALLHAYLEKDAYESMLPLLDRMLELHNPPSYFYYWRAECLYRLGEMEGSWLAYEAYLNQRAELD